ncbi:MAG: hypothetical protein RR622_09585 [Hydrogenoanaerobacterium sp.]
MPRLVKAIANGNPKIKEKMELDVELLKLRVLKSEYSKKHFRLQDEFETKYPQNIEKNLSAIKKFKSDIVLRNENTSFDFAISFAGKLYTDKDIAGELLIKLSCNTNENIGVYRGFKIESARDFGEPYLRLCGSYKYRVELSDSAIGMIQRLDNALNSVEKQISRLELENLQNNEYIAQAKAEYKKPFEEEAEFKLLQERQIALEKELELDQKPKDETAWTENDIEIAELQEAQEDEYELEN